MPNRTGKFYHVEREGFLSWSLYARTTYRGRLIARFWTQKAAQEAADRLNKFEEDLPRILADEAAYEEWMKEVLSKPIQSSSK